MAVDATKFGQWSSETKPAPQEGRSDFLGVYFDAVTGAEAAERIMAMVASRTGGWVATVNVAILMMLRDEPALREYVEGSALVVADGQPIIWGSRLLTPSLPERVTGVDLLERLCALCEVRGRSVYLLGGTDDVVRQAAARIQDAYPALRLGFADGYFPEGEAAERAQAVRDFGADILVVGMGVPRQERFIMAQWETLGVPVAIGVGGSFNVIAGTLRRAPLWMQRAGLEWFYRLKQEPRRLFKRYAVTNTQFCFRYAKEIAAVRRVDRARRGMR